MRGSSVPADSPLGFFLRGACIVSLEYPCFFLSVLGLVRMSMHSSRNTCQHVCDMLVSLLHRIDCWLAWQKMTSQSSKNPAALTPIWPQFKDQQQQSGQRYTHTHTHIRTHLIPTDLGVGGCTLCICSPAGSLAMLFFNWIWTEYFFSYTSSLQSAVIYSETFQWFPLSTHSNWPQWNKFRGGVCCSVETHQNSWNRY